MRGIRIAAVLTLAVAVVMALGVGSAFAVVDDVYMVSSSAAGVQGDATSANSFCSSNGRYVVFESQASNLVAGDTNGKWDIFVRDTWTNAVTRVSVGPGGAEGNGDSGSSHISFDGRYVVFNSEASNLVANDTNGDDDVFMHDRVSGVTTRISVAAGGVQADNASYRPRISGNGKFVAFYSYATNLVTGDTNDTSDVFVYDVSNGAVTRESVGAGGVQADNYSDYCYLSLDGRYVSFSSRASNLAGIDANSNYDVFVRDRTAGTTTLVSQTAAGAAGNGWSDYNAISADGLTVVWTSNAPDLVAGDTNGLDDVFVRNLVTGVTERVSVSSAGVQGTENAGYRSSLSADGRYVAFSSRAPGLVADDTNGADDAFIRDRQLATTRRVSTDKTGWPGNGDSNFPAISPEGDFVSFETNASNLVPGDSNGRVDVVLKQLTELATHLPATVSSVTPKYAAPVTITGVLHKYTADGPGIEGADVFLQSKGSAGWVDIKGPVKTSATGVAAFSVAPKSKTTYRLRFGGAARTYVASASGDIVVTPKVSVGTPVAPKTMKKSKYYTVYGSLKPKHTKGTKPVRIYKYKKVGSKWKSYGYVKAKAYNYKTYTRYKIKMRLTSKGKWRLRAYAPADSKHAATWSSKYDYVTVK